MIQIAPTFHHKLLKYEGNTKIKYNFVYLAKVLLLQSQTIELYKIGKKLVLQLKAKIRTLSSYSKV